ncbi:HlyC/CorC family transporter [Telmatospirillum sp.]|uniref:HlyC/CorC family transporter n=1 Tax=Telmatospirillum sp. TaxID=2079197 RepID=UPI002841DDDB|nr:HlyC/CorC family transporter [Telmatospirillum sp.]MDR3437012.1 HlyC/CorC family transporter [Telmatospirillum sp.]
MILNIVAIVVLLLLLFFFSCSETSLTVVSKPLMHQLEVEGDSRAALVNRLQNRKERLLGSILLGNTLVQILASALATSVAIAMFGDAGVAYGTVFMTVIVLVFCEILPKTIAIHQANTLALALAPIMRAIAWLFGPPILAVQAFVNGLLRLIGVPLNSEVGIDETMAELRGAIDIHTVEDDVKHERKMLRSILDLGDVEVGEIMNHRKNLVTINAALPMSVILDQVTASPYTRLPLWKGDHDNIVGVIHSKDLLRAVRNHTGDLDEIDIVGLATPPWFIPDSTTLIDQLQAFRKRREHFALVVDEYGTLLGVVTLEDIIEEIVGEISDEHDVQVAGVRPQPDGTCIVNGDVTIRDLNREYDWRLPDEHAATIAGLLLHESRMIPEVNQVFLFYGFRFEVLRRVRNQIISIRLTPPSDAGPQENS